MTCLFHGKRPCLITWGKYSLTPFRIYTFWEKLRKEVSYHHGAIKFFNEHMLIKFTYTKSLASLPPLYENNVFQIFFTPHPPPFIQYNIEFLIQYFV